MMDSLTGHSMSNPFMSLIRNPHKYYYECESKVKPFNPEMKTDHVHGKYLVVICEDCCNVPVCHLLKKNGE